MNINDIKKGHIVKTYLFLLVLLILSAFLSYVDSFAQETIPLTFEVKPESAAYEFLTFNDFQDLKIIKSTGYSEVDAEIDNSIEGQSNIKAVLTNGKYGDLYGMKFEAGGFFDNKMVSTKAHYVVISEQMSIDLFLRLGSVGEEIYIADSKYTIIGIYKNDDSFWAKLSRDRYDRVYIPYTTYPGYRDIKLDALAVDNASQKASINKLLIEYPGLVDGNINLDYSVKLKCSTQFQSLIKFVITIAILLFLIMLAYKIIRTFTGSLSNQRSAFYFKDIIRKNVKMMCIVSLIILAMTGVVILIVRNLHFPLYIPGTLLPKENLFDIKYYMDEISSFFMKDNSMFMSGNNFYYLLVNKTLAVEIVLSIFILIFIFLLLASFRRVARKNLVIAIELIGYLGIVLLLSFVMKHWEGAMFFAQFTSIMLYYAAILFTSMIYEASIKYIDMFYE